MRHGTLKQYDPKPGVSISTLAYEYPAGHNVPEHAHDSDQLIYATRGVMEVSAGQRLWLTPPHLALWIPARTRHRIRMPRQVSMRTLYLRRGRLKRGGSCETLALDEALAFSKERSSELLALDEALDRLARQDERQSQIVEMKFFGGLGIEEIAEVLGTSPRTVKRDWTMARAWLHQEIMH